MDRGDGGDEDAPHTPFVMPFAGGVAAYLEPGAPMNKVSGIGFSDAATAAEIAALAEIEAAFLARECPVQIELSSLADPSFGPLLTRRGYVLQGFEDVLGIEVQGFDRDAAAAQLAAACRTSDLCIGLSGDDSIPTWVELTVDGFAVPDGQGVASSESFPRELLQRVMNKFVRTSGFLRYIVTRAGVPAGAGCWRLGPDGIGQMCGAATLPAHRRRGIQSLLLQRRLIDAQERGAEFLTMTTQPGSKSQQNALRAGFSRLFTRAVLVKAPV